MIAIFCGLRINNPSLKDTLVGEAGKICMDLNLQRTTSFTKYLLELCNIKVNSLKNFIIPQKELENFCHCLKNILKFVDYWKDNIQQSVNQGKLRTFKRLKIIFEFEKYISEIGNIKHRQAILQSSEFRLIDYLLKQLRVRSILQCTYLQDPRCGLWI
jgi:hypothetical protein